MIARVEVQLEDGKQVDSHQQPDDARLRTRGETAFATSLNKRLANAFHSVGPDLFGSAAFGVFLSYPAFSGQPLLWLDFADTIELPVGEGADLRAAWGPETPVEAEGPFFASSDTHALIRCLLKNPDTGALAIKLVQGGLQIDDAWTRAMGGQWRYQGIVGCL